MNRANTNTFLHGVAAMIPLVITCTTTAYIHGEKDSEITRAEYIDVNKDGNSDIIVYNKTGRSKTFYGINEGTYKNSEGIVSEENERMNEENKKKISELEKIFPKTTSPRDIKERK